MTNIKSVTKMQRGKKILKSLALSTVKVMVIILITFYIILYFYQDDFLFIKQGISVETLNAIHTDYPKVENITIIAKDNIKLRGWFVRQPSIKKAPLLIYFGGNAEEVSDMIEDSNKVKGWAIALVNYRGYGQSQGEPNEKNLFSDALSIYDYFSKREEIDNKRIVLMGRSLGSGVAIYLAKERPAKGIILITPYDSMTSVAQEKFPFAPVLVLLKNRFNSISRVSGINTPLLALIAEDDEVIPPHHAERLTEKWKGEKIVKVIKDVGHNTIQNGDRYWESISKFLTQL